ncbi:MAG TPA: agmatine deiminase family protein [Robiginitalea sp.]|nr:agmatine deiminase family protein [Robiginitalea sp.]
MGTRQAIRYPAEWEPQEGVLLCYPHNGHDWPGKYGAIQWALIDFIKKVAEVETVFLLVRDRALPAIVHEKLERAHVNTKQVQYIVCKTNRSWMRDSGPIGIYRNGKRSFLKFAFNGWAKYTNYRLDRHVAGVVSSHFSQSPLVASYRGKEVVLEGGALESNGRGTLITSEECLLHPSVQVRNPGFTREDYEAVFREFLGITHVIWVNKGIVGDDTHGHIDDLCRFVSPDTIVAVEEENPKDENYAILQENLELLRKSRLQDGSKPKIVTLPMPRPILYEGLRLPASYANFLILNQRVLVPTFNDVNDARALGQLAACFPDREVIGIHALDLIWGFGTLHCLSQQVPAAASRI